MLRIPARFTRLGALALLALLPLAAAAQAWPAKPIRMIANFPPGGVVDQIARLIAPQLGEALGQPVLVENRAGANGNIGGVEAARGAPDGHTLLIATASIFTTNPHMYAKMPFDPNKDLEPLAVVGNLGAYLIVRPGIPAANAREFFALLRANPGKFAYGSPGIGSLPHMAAEIMLRQIKAGGVHVPYKGAAPVLTDLLGGTIDFTMDPGPGLEHARAGKLRLLAVGTPQRHPQFPDVPTLTEAGVENYDPVAWVGLYAPTGLPAEISARLNREITRIVQSPAFRERMVGLGVAPVTATREQQMAALRAEGQRMAVLIREQGIKAE